jgi:hypothetical protein
MAQFHRTPFFRWRESAIEAQYDRVKNYPSMKRGYDRDMATVRQARKMLEED